MPNNEHQLQWGWGHMEELLQCPVCLDLPRAAPGFCVEQCDFGHHFCSPCKLQLKECPLCKKGFSGTRNFVVEELLRNIEVIKNTMQLNGIMVEDKPKKKKPRVILKNSTEQDETPRIFLRTPNGTKGLYSCRVLDCKAELPSGRLLNHVRSCHGDVYREVNVDNSGIYNGTWEVTYKNKKPINRCSQVIFAKGIGLVFVNIEILRSGQMIAVVQMGTKFRVAQQYLACLEFFSNAHRYEYNTKLISVREQVSSMIQKKLCFTLTKFQFKNMCVNNKFNCKLKLSRYNEIDSTSLTATNENQINMIAGMRASIIEEEEKQRLIAALEDAKKKDKNKKAKVNEISKGKTVPPANTLASLPNGTQNIPGTSKNNNAQIGQRPSSSKTPRTVVCTFNIVSSQPVANAATTTSVQQIAESSSAQSSSRRKRRNRKRR